MKTMFFALMLLGLGLTATLAEAQALATPVSTVVPIPTTPGGGGGSTTKPELPVGLRTAQAFLEAGDYDSVRLQFYFTAVFDDGHSEKKHGQCIMNNVCRFPFFALYKDDNESEWDVLVDWTDEPLPGFPFFSAKGVENFGIYVYEAYGPSGISRIYGGFNAERLKFKQPILIELRPGWVEYFHPFKLADTSVNLMIRWTSGDGSGTAQYDSERGGFNLWVDPLIPFSYEIYDPSTGIVIDRGNGMPGQLPAPMMNTSAVNLSYINGVKKVQFDVNNWAGFDCQSADTLFSFLPPGCSLYIAGQQNVPPEPWGVVPLLSIKVWGFSGPGQPLVPISVTSDGFTSWCQISAGQFTGVIVEVPASYQVYFSLNRPAPMPVPPGEKG